jgi:hypothetical protein
LPPPPPPVVVYEPPALVAPGLVFEEGDPLMNQQLSEAQLEILWHTTNPTVPFDLTHGIPSTWANLVQKRPDLYIGSPQGDEVSTTVNGKKVNRVKLTSGRELIWFEEDNSVKFL